MLSLLAVVYIHFPSHILYSMYEFKSIIHNLYVTEKFMIILYICVELLAHHGTAHFCHLLYKSYKENSAISYERESTLIDNTTLKLYQLFHKKKSC
jgi:hypothetical protein